MTGDIVKKGIIAACIALMLFLTIPRVAFAQDVELVGDENTIRVESIVEEPQEEAQDEATTDVAVNENDDDMQEQITINDEEVPLYAGETSLLSYVLYAWVLIIGAILIFGGVYIFIRKRTE